MEENSIFVLMSLTLYEIKELKQQTLGTFSTESFHSDDDVGGRRRLGRGRRCSRQNINL